MILGSRAQPVRRVDNLPAICLDSVETLTSHNHTRLHGLLRGWLYYFLIQFSTSWPSSCAKKIVLRCRSLLVNFTATGSFYRVGTVQQSMFYVFTVSWWSNFLLFWCVVVMVVFVLLNPIHLCGGRQSC
jgi:hypothetical protein